MMRHVLTVLVENHSGVLVRVAGLFSRRGYNIDSLSVGRTENPHISRMTIVVEGDDLIVEQVTKQLNKLVDIIKIQDISSDEFVDRELILVKVGADAAMRSEIIQIVDIFRARIVDIGVKTLMIECTGTEGKINAVIDSLRPFGIKEIVRTGKVAMLRGQKFTSVNENWEED